MEARTVDGAEVVDAAGKDGVVWDVEPVPDPVRGGGGGEAEERQVERRPG